MKPHIKKVYCDNLGDWMWYCAMSPMSTGNRYFAFAFTPERAYSAWLDGFRLL